MLRRHDTDNDLGLVERRFQIAGRANGFGQGDAGEKAIVDSASGDALDNFRFVGPERDLMRFSSTEDDGEARAPSAGADDCDAAHWRVAPMLADLVTPDLVTGDDFVPSLDSVPAPRRAIFCRCFQITSSDTAAIKSSCRESEYSWKVHAKRGNAAAVMTDASET